MYADFFILTLILCADWQIHFFGATNVTWVRLRFRKREAKMEENRIHIGLLHWHKWGTYQSQRDVGEDGDVDDDASDGAGDDVSHYEVHTAADHDDEQKMWW